jgi:hypothetical protein
MRHVNDREPNFHAADGRLFLVRCFACGGEHGTENWAMAVSSGRCAFCGWADQPAPAAAASPATPATAPA